MIRGATSDDVATLVELWREFEAEAHEPAWRGDDAEIRQRELERAIGTNIVLLAEQDARPIGLAVADTKSERVGFLHVLYVRPSARQLGVAAALVRATVDRLRAQGRDMLELEVPASNEACAFGLRALGIRTRGNNPRRQHRHAGRTAQVDRRTRGPAQRDERSVCKRP